MTDRPLVSASLRLFALAAVLVAPLACGGGNSSSGTGGSGGHAGRGGGAGTQAGGTAGGAAAGAAGGAIGGAAGMNTGGAGGGVAGAAGGVAGHAPGGAAGGAAGHAPGGAAGSQAGGGAGGYAGAAGSAGAAGGTGAAGTAGSAGMGGTGGALTVLTGNLLMNGGAEAAVGSANGLPVATPGWTSDGEATAMQYGQSGYPASTDPGPAERGANLFIGGYNDAVSTLTQTVDVSSFATAIDTGTLAAVLSGYFGGYSSQGDNAVLTATFQDGAGQALGTAVTVGGVTAADRNNITGLLLRSQQGNVPAGTRKILVVLTMTRTEGNANDGYADELALALSLRI